MLLSPHGLYSQNRFLIFLRYVISEYQTVEVRSADTQDIGIVLLGDSLGSSMVDVRLHSQPTSKFQARWSANVRANSRRLLSTLLSKWGKLRVKLVSHQFMERGKLRTNLQDLQTYIFSRRKFRQMPSFLYQNLISSLHRHRMISPPLFFLIKLEEVLFFLITRSLFLYRETCPVTKRYGILPVKARWDQIYMIPQTMVITSATPVALQVLGSTEDRKLRKFLFFHLKHLWKCFSFRSPYTCHMYVVPGRLTEYVLWVRKTDE